MAYWANRRAAFDDMRIMLSRWQLSILLEPHIDKLEQMKGVKQEAADEITAMLKGALKAHSDRAIEHLKPVVLPPVTWKSSDS